MLEASPLPAVIVGSDFKVQAMNDACRRLVTSKVIPGRTTCHEVFHGCPVPTGSVDLLSCPLRRCMKCRHPKQVQHYHQTAQGGGNHLVSVYPLPDRDGEVRVAMQTYHPVGEDEAFVRTMPRVARSREMREAFDLSRRVAGEEMTVLLMGESGTGRRQLAKWIHDLSPRRSGPFVSLSCVGLGEGELRVEIFGHQLSWNREADGYRIGLVDAARQGTLFIEEVADLGPRDQRTLLRLLRGEVAHDLRLICSTRYPLISEVIGPARLHPALFFRIARYPIQVPPIRRRAEDFPVLARILLAEVEPTRRMVLEPETLTALMLYSFPGNLIELRSALIWATLMTDDTSILPHHLPPRIQASSLKTV